LVFGSFYLLYLGRPASIYHRVLVKTIPKETGKKSTVSEPPETVPPDFPHYFFSPRNDKNVKIAEDKTGVPLSVEVVKLDLPDGGILLEAGVETSIL
jgi:hypothetical protein